MTTYVSLNNLRVPYTMIVINLLTNVSAFFRDSHACGLRNIFVFILVRWSYDFNSSSPGLIETNQHWDYATILLFLRSHCKVLRLSCETRAELTRDLPLRTQIREYPKLCGPAFRSTCIDTYGTGLEKKHASWVAPELWASHKHETALVRSVTYVTEGL